MSHRPAWLVVLAQLRNRPAVPPDSQPEARERLALRVDEAEAQFLARCIGADRLSGDGGRYWMNVQSLT